MYVIFKLTRSTSENIRTCFKCGTSLAVPIYFLLYVCWDHKKKINCGRFEISENALGGEKPREGGEEEVHAGKKIKW